MLARSGRLIAALLLVAASPAPDGNGRPRHRPAPTPGDLQRTEQSRAAELATQRQQADRAASAEANARRTAEARVAAAARLREAEEATQAAAGRIAALSAQARDAETALAARARAFTPLLPMMERLSLYPAETLIAVPAIPEQALRGLLVLGGLSRQIAAEATTLRAEQDRLATLRASIDAEMPRLAASQAAQAREAAALDAQLASSVAERDAAANAAAAAARRAADLGGRADTLRAALTRIDAERQLAADRARQTEEAAERQRRTADAATARAEQEALARPPGTSVGEPHGQLTAPVAGTVLHGYGEAGEDGRRNGISYRTAPSARVVSPCGGRVAFAGPFRSYGQLMIVDCGGAYHFVLAGFDRIDAQPGQAVAAGEPVGAMPAWDPRAAGAPPALYLELRRNGDPVNPAPFLRARG